jgi:hypothetical protein
MIPKSVQRFPERSCFTNNPERDDGSKKSHHAPGAATQQNRPNRQRIAKDARADCGHIWLWWTNSRYQLD